MDFVLVSPPVWGNPPDKGMLSSLGFRKCHTCNEVILVMDKLCQCIRCLGEGHIQQKCSLSQQLQPRSCKDREKIIFMEAAL